MAKVKFTPSIEEIAGKIGDYVFSRNRSGNYIRKRVIPNNPKTTFQEASRGRLSSSSKAWGGLSDDNRKAWNNFAGARIIPVKDSLDGTTQVLSGKALFQEAYINIRLLGGTTIPTTPTLAPVATTAFPGELEIDKANNKVLLKFGSAIGSNGGIYLSCTEELSAGTSYYRGRYKGLYGYAAPGGSTAVLDFSLAYALRFGGVLPTSGNRQALVKIIDSGFFSVSTQAVPVTYA